MVAENKLNPANIHDTVKDGRINKGDILNALSNLCALSTPTLE